MRPLLLTVVLSALSLVGGCGRTSGLARGGVSLHGSEGDAPSPSQQNRGRSFARQAPDPLVRSWLQDGARARADAAPVTVLLPRHPAAVAGAVITFGQSWAAASLPLEGAVVYVHATDLRHDPPERADAQAPDLRVRGQNARVAENEGIRSVTWTEGGVTHAVEIECDRPADDVRCTGEAYVLAFADALVPAS